MPKKDLTQLAYQTLQNGKSIAGLVHKGLSTKLMEMIFPEANPDTQPVSPELLNKLRLSIAELEKVDWQEAEQGLYPKAQLFEAPWAQWAKNYPNIWLDLPSTWIRRRTRSVQDIPLNIDRDNYPDYYLQNFHHQTDGYLSNHSASLYDLQVEILFNGTADVMRRRIIAPLKRGLNKFNDRKPSSIRVLDVATGTGRTLKQVKSAVPEIELLGIDLSNSYLKQANKYLNTKNGEHVQLIRGNAEELPFSSNSLQGVTCVFLLHELPQMARQNVLNECFRVLEPGGVFILADSIQLADSPEFTTVMENFYKFFHEPYYRNYINDDIKTRLNTSGFEGITAQSHFMTRIWSATKSSESC